MRVIYIDGNKIEFSLVEQYVDSSIKENIVSCSIRENKITIRLKDKENPFIKNISYYVDTFKVELEHFEEYEVYGFSELDAYGSIYDRRIRS